MCDSLIYTQTKRTHTVALECAMFVSAAVLWGGGGGAAMYFLQECYNRLCGEMLEQFVLTPAQMQDN